MITYYIIGTTVIVSFLCFSQPGLLQKLSFNSYAIIRAREWFRLVTHGFVHADMTHLFVNMFTLWSFGTHMERFFTTLGLGVWGYAGLYFGGMIFASLYDLVKQRSNPAYNSVGASGAISAVLFASILLNPWGLILLFAVIPVPGIIFGILYLVYCQYMARHSAGHVNHNAHFYGAVFGLVFPVLLRPSLLADFIEQLFFFFNR
ncbi:MAG: rhomboid family intramembrane serine protease [Tannerella sp.]|jgi:membrane associated rhomboid family serine protease|nr:rhomboid family intramembrane serine protease [Tannerella sp.]